MILHLFIQEAIQQTQSVTGALSGMHILDIIGGFSPAALIYIWWAERRNKSQIAETELWKSEAEKYQAKWVDAMEKLSEHPDP